MKLRDKIIVTFGGTVLVSVLACGLYAYNTCSKLTMNSINQGIITSSDLAADQIAAKIEDYMKITTVSGIDVTLSGNSSDSVKGDRVDELAAEYEFTSGNILGIDGISLKDHTDFSERDYVKKALAGETNISDITLSKYTNTYGFSVAAPTKDHSGNVNGVVYYRLDIDFMSEILNYIDMSANSYAFIVDGEGTVIVHQDETLINNMNLTEEGGGLAALEKEIQMNGTGTATYTLNGKTMICGYAQIEGTNGWTLVLTAPESDFTVAVESAMKTLSIVDVLLIVVAIGIAIAFGYSIGHAAVKVKDLLLTIAKGDFSTQIEKSNKKDELSILQNTAIDLQREFKNMIGETNHILGSMSDYDLSVNDMNSYPGAFNELSRSVNKIKGMLKSMITEVQESASAVGTGSGQLASAADALSQGTVSQASSIDKVVMDVQDVATRIHNNSENEIIVENKLKALDGLIGNGNKEMTELLTVVKEVADMSSDIQKIVGTIDSIAFQTNILALNASVEAARAGENGKGFAVVADEVGNLAAKTSEASKQTSELIGKCIDRIDHAKDSANMTFDCLKQIVENSSDINQAFEEISQATKEQAVKSDNIRQEMNIISDVVQNNTATAEETAAATQELSAQANTLSFMIQKFNIR